MSAGPAWPPRVSSRYAAAASATAHSPRLPLGTARDETANHRRLLILPLTGEPRRHAANHVGHLTKVGGVLVVKIDQAAFPQGVRGGQFSGNLTEEAHGLVDLADLARTRCDGCLLPRRLREVEDGGILFTTLQKFRRTQEERDSGSDHPLLSQRRNIIVIADEAHRSHYDDLDGYARHIRDALPNALFIAFTGTPISFEDRNTEAVFGPVIDTYDLTRAVKDGATVSVYFEARLIKVGLTMDVTEEDLDRSADEATIGLDEVERARIEKSVAVVSAAYGAPDRLRKLAADLVEHWENRSAQLVKFIGTPGKALIVGGTPGDLRQHL